MLIIQQCVDARHDGLYPAHAHCTALSIPHGDSVGWIGEDTATADDILICTSIASTVKDNVWNLWRLTAYHVNLWSDGVIDSLLV